MSRANEQSQFARQKTSSISAAPVPTTTNNTQSLSGPVFIGNPFQAHPLPSQTIIQPAVQNQHQGSGNQGFLTYPGPLGENLSITSYDTTLEVLFWGLNNTLTAACISSMNGTIFTDLCATNVQDLSTLAMWQPDNATEYINMAYSELVVDTNTFVLNSKQGNIYVVVRVDGDGQTPTFMTTRKFEIEVEGFLRPSETLMNSFVDTAGNIWFTTGAIVGNEGQPEQYSATIGYVEPNGTIHAIHLPNEIIENGIAVSNTTMFAITGPTGANDHANATGNLYAFTAGQSGNSSSITMLWKMTYDAGSGLKPGGFARGSGTSPTLLGNDFVAIADNADHQINLIVFAQADGTRLCSVQLFQPDASATDNALVNAWDGETYGIVAVNDYNGAPVYNHADINGASNNMTNVSAGFQRVNVTPQLGGGASCATAWNTKIRTKCPAVISTQSGLVYTWTQSAALALQGEYEWYATAVDFVTGEITWRARAGAGGVFNDNYAPSELGPDGSLYQGVVGGIVRVKDERR